MPKESDVSSKTNSSLTMETLLEKIILITNSLNFIHDKVLPQIEQIESRYVSNTIKNNFFESEVQQNLSHSDLLAISPYLEFVFLSRKYYPDETILALPIPPIPDAPLEKNYTLGEYIKLPDRTIIQQLDGFDLITTGLKCNPFKKIADEFLKFVEAMPKPAEDKALADFFCFKFLKRFLMILVQHIRANLQTINLYYFLHESLFKLPKDIMLETTDQPIYTVEFTEDQWINYQKNNYLSNLPNTDLLWNQFKQNFETLKTKFPILNNLQQLFGNFFFEQQQSKDTLSIKELLKLSENKELELEALIESLSAVERLILPQFSTDENWPKLATENPNLIQKILSITAQEQFYLRKDVQSLKDIQKIISTQLKHLRALASQEPQKVISASWPATERKLEILKLHQEFYQIISQSNGFFNNIFNTFNVLMSLPQKKESVIYSSILNKLYMEDMNSAVFTKELKMSLIRVRMFGLLSICNSSIPDSNVSSKDLLALPITQDKAANKYKSLTLEELFSLPDVNFFELLSGESHEISAETIKILFNTIGIDKRLPVADFNFQMLKHCYLPLINIFKTALSIILSWNKNINIIYNVFLLNSKNLRIQDSSAKSLMVALNDSNRICNNLTMLYPKIAENIAENLGKEFHYPNGPSSHDLCPTNYGEKISKIDHLLKLISTWLMNNAGEKLEGCIKKSDTIKNLLPIIMQELTKLSQLAQSDDYKKLSNCFNNSENLNIYKRYSGTISDFFGRGKGNGNSHGENRNSTNGVMPSTWRSEQPAFPRDSLIFTKQ